MQNFVKLAAQRTQPGDAQNSQPGSVNRGAIAANAKVQVKRTVLDHQDHTRRNQPMHRQSGHQISSIVAQKQPQQIRQDQYRGTNAFDTDAESIDTTTHQPSVIQISDVQQHAQQYGQGLHGDGESEDDESREDRSSNDSEDIMEGGQGEEPEIYDNQQGIFQHHGYPNQPPANRRLFGDRPRDPSMFGGGESYPSTTSGAVSNIAHDFNGDVVSLEGDDGRNISPSPRPTGKSYAQRQISDQPSQRVPANTNIKSAIHDQTSRVIHEAAALRSNPRIDANAPVHGRAFHPSQYTALPSSQATAAFPLQLHSVNINAPKKLGFHSAHAPPHGSLQPSSSTYVQSARLVQLPVAVEREAAAQLIGGNSYLQEPIEVAPSHQKPKGKAPIAHQNPHSDTSHQQHVRDTQAHDRGPIEDYDRPTLFEMEYEDLKKQDFDFVPRGITQVLPKDMLQKSLDERLTYVKQNLDVENQGKFFSSLNTDEWEDAGDWFVEQFGIIIKRTKEARQAKRKLAIAFETDIELRHKRVSKKQLLVEGALNKMKLHGESLMPKTPTPSRSLKNPKKEK